ncbi:MAG: hypothetical protein K5644_01865 [Lachnospiraceae bacterium]|nr:hypothetical protein [Lachnospiraceae bacterium]
MIAAVLLIVTIILSKTKKIGSLMTPKIKKIVIAVELVGIVASVGELVMNNVLFDNSLSRPAAGEADTTEELQYETNGNKTDITLDVPAALHSKEEKESFIENAKEEIDDTFIGDNEDLDNINQAVVMKESYADGMVKAEWQLSDYKIIGADGEINYENLDKEKIIEANVTLTCEDMSDVYSFSFRVEPFDTSSVMGIDYYIKKAIRELFKEEGETITLPDKVGDNEVVWNKKYTFLGAKIALLGIFAAIVMVIGQMKEDKNKQANYLKRLERDYPKIVEGLALYVGAGLSVKNSIYRLCEEYINRRDKKEEPGFEGLLKMCREIEEGRSEIKAYESLPEYCPTREYRRLSSLLTNNLRKGTKGLIDQLNKEEEDAFDMERAYVKIAGEEASTKLLFPMIGLLGIVLIIIIAPSIFNMNTI